MCIFLFRTRRKDIITLFNPRQLGRGPRRGIKWVLRRRRLRSCGSLGATATGTVFSSRSTLPPTEVGCSDTSGTDAKDGMAWRTATSPIDAVSRLGVRTAALSPPFPMGEVLPSTSSAEATPSLFGRFIGTVPSSELLIRVHAHLLAVAFMSRSGIAVRTRMRSPRFRAKNVSTCTRSPTARGSSHASHSRMR